jgi:hypothetical protein
MQRHRAEVRSESRMPTLAKLLGVILVLGILLGLVLIPPVGQFILWIME